MTEDSEVIEAAKILAEAIRRVSYGGDTGPTGLEMLSMAISGEAPRRWPAAGRRHRVGRCSARSNRGRARKSAVTLSQDRGVGCRVEVGALA